MIGTIQKYFRCTLLVLGHGRLRHSGENFNQLRKDSLKDLEEFIPAGKIPDISLPKRSVIRNLVGQISFVKNSFRERVGHLTVENLCYIRIPKSASTSISKEILYKRYPALNQRKVNEKQINFLADVNLDGEIRNDRTFFTIVRNPFERLVSVYRDFFEGQSNFIYRDYMFGVLTQTLSFTEFINRIASIPDRLRDQHFRSQYSFLESYHRKKIAVKIFKLEDSESLGKFMTGNSMQLPHLNKSVQSYDYRSYYNEQTVLQVYEIYEDEIARFGYENAAEELRNHIKTVQK